MYLLINTFQSNRVVSRHRTQEAACRASWRYQRAIRLANGESSYMPTAIEATDGDVLDEAHTCEWCDGSHRLIRHTQDGRPY